MTFDRIPYGSIDHMPRNAWMSTDGTLYLVDDYGHCDAAIDHLNDETGGDRLEEDGWLHISVNRHLYISCSHPRFTQRQLDVLWDIYAHRPEHPVLWQTDAIAQLRRLLNITVQ